MIKENDTIERIIQIEWNMFVKVRNIGGTASCQKNPGTFKIMRMSQFVSWSDNVLESYLDDLLSAKKDGRNLMTEKYARMMESTLPFEYEKIKDLLPVISNESRDLVDQIVEVVLEWERELMERFPFLVSRGRPVYSCEDKPCITSIETYLRGELLTYSYRTLKLYLDNILEQKKENINASEINILHIVKSYGWQTLEEANEKLKSS